MSTDVDEFADLDFDDEDEFADLDEYAEPEVEDISIDLSKPTCWTCGDGVVIDGRKCHKCGKKIGWEAVEEAAREKAAARAAKSGPPKPIISGHCAWPQTKDPHLSHERCAHHGAGSTANPEKRFHPCPCPCHLAHTTEAGPAEVWLPNPDGTYGEVITYECDGCGGILAEAPIFGLDEDGDPFYVHVDRKDRMIYTGPCQ